MRTVDVIQGSGNRSQTLRLLMLMIIAGTFPFYCLGVIIIGSAPVEDVEAIQQHTEVSDATFTPLGADITPSATPSPYPTRVVTPTQVIILRPTPYQFVPPPTLVSTSTVAQTVVTAAPTAPAGGRDADSDGILDDADRCPNEFGYADSNGCPDLEDEDRDGIRGDADVCPNEYAPESPRGCRDFDDDGLDSSLDACPKEAGPASNRGCP